MSEFDDVIRKAPEPEPEAKKALKKPHQDQPLKQKV